jgi:membrane protease YdiL (CAAX protease family)
VIGLVVLAITYLVLQTVVLSALLIPALLSGRFSLEDLSTDATSLTAELVSDPIGLAAATLAIATGIVAAALALLAGHQLRPGWLHSVVGRMRWRFLAACLGLGTAAVVTHVVASSVFVGVAGGDDLPLEPGRPQLLLALVALLLVPLQAAGEEYVFRGYALQALGAWFRRPWLPLLLTSLVFSAAHLGDPASSVWFFMFGALAAYLTVRTGGLEAAIGLHVAWNTVTLLLLALIGADSGEAISSRDDSSWLLPLVSVPVFLAYALAVLWVARRMGLDTTTRPTPAAPAWVQPQYVGSFGQPPGPR